MTDYRETSCSLLIKDKIFFGGCAQNSDPYSGNVLVYVNTTSPTPVPKPGDRNTGGSCDCSTEWNISASGTHWNSAYVGSEEYWLTQSLNQDMLTVQTFLSGSHVNLGKCQNQGFKGVAALRPWHGVVGWNSNDGCSPTQSIAADQTKYRTVTYDVHSRQNFDAGEAAGAYTYADKTGTRSVGAITGILSSSILTTRLSADNYGGSIGVQISSYSYGGAGYTAFEGTQSSVFLSGMTTMLDDVDTDLHCLFPRIRPDGATLLPTLIDDWNQAIAGSGSIFGSDPSVNPFVGSSLPALTDSSSYSGTGVGTLNGGAETWSVDFTWSRGATVAAWDFNMHQYGPSEGEDNTYHYYGSITLSDANTFGDVLNDEVTLLSHWPLNNNAVYPWRTDSYTMYLPKMARREVPMDINPIGFNTYTVDDLTSPVYVSGSIDHYGQMLWKDPNSFFWVNLSASVATAIGDTHLDGTILGIPFLVDTSSIAISGSPVSVGSGSGQVWGYFNFYYNDYRFCKTPVDIDCGVSPPWELYKYRLGGTLADCDISNSGNADGGQFINILPQCSTFWTDNIEAHSIPKGASIICHNGSIAGIMTVKYAECRPKYPSHNFFKPCSSDRAAINEDTAQCFVDDLVMFDALPTASGEILLAFTNGFDGIYTGSSQTLRMDTHYDLTLGTKIRDLPSNYFHPFETQFKDAIGLGDFGLVGVLRFPSAWPICGREAVTVVSGSGGTGSLITFTTGQPNLATSDKVTLYSGTMAILVPSASLYRNSDTEFTSSISFVSSSISASQWAQSSGSPDFHWHDISSKLNVRWGEWTQNNRSGVTTSSSFEGCVSGSPCAESVICFSPNGEVFPNGTTTWFSGSTIGDDVYGSMRQLNVEFGMIDPFYQQPKKPCNINNTIFPSYVQDDGSCLDDGTDGDGNPIYRYPPPPLIEAMLTPPSGSPALPVGVVWTPLAQPTIPGIIGFSFSSPIQPWNIMSNELYTCDNNPACRWIQFYSAC